MTIPQKAPSAKRPYFTRSIIIVICGVAFSVAGWVFARKQMQLADTERFGRVTDRLMVSVKDNMRAVELILRSEVALFDANMLLEREEWEIFADSVLPEVNQYVAGLTYIERVPSSRLPAFLSQAKAEYGPDIKLVPSGDRREYYIIRYSKAFNYPLGIGLDVATDQTRREALERAMLTGRSTLSKHTFLLLENTKTPACLMYMPIYSKGAAPTTPEERHERLQGWVSARIRLNEIVANWDTLSGKQLDYEIYDGRDVISPGTFVLASHQPLVASTLKPSIDPWVQDGRMVGFRHDGFGNDCLTVCFIATPAFDAAGSHLFADSILIGGLMVSMLAGGLVWTLGTSKSRAQELAAIMTEQFHQTEAEARKLAHIASRTNNAVIVVDVAGQVDWVNQSFTRITGYTPAEAHGREAAKFIIGPKTDPAVAEEIRKVLRLGQAFHREILLQHKSGKVFWLDLEIQAVRDTTGRLLYNLVIGTDITERKQAEAELVTKEAEYRFIFEASPVGISWRIVRSDGSTTRHVNEAHLAICGLTRAQLDEPGIFVRITNPEDRKKQEEFYKRMESGEITNFSMPKRYHRLDGSTVWSTFRMIRKNYPDGSFQELSLISDISDLKHAEEDLARQEAQFRFIFDHVPVGITWLQVKDGKKLNNTRIINPAHTHITGVTKEQSHDFQNYLKLINPDDWAKQRAQEARVHSGEIESFSMEKRYFRADGRVVWGLYTMHGFLDPVTNLQQELTTLVDITELKKIQEDAAQVHQRMQIIFESVPIGLAWTIVGQPESRIVNEAHERITGVVLKTAHSDPDAYKKVTHPEDQDKQDELTARLARGEINTLSLEKRYLRPNGDIVSTLLTIRRFTDEITGQVQEVTAIADITEQKRQAEELRLAKEAADRKTAEENYLSKRKVSRQR